MNGREPRILVAGEALIDFVPHPDATVPGFTSIPGGSPLNVAIGLARLGIQTSFLCRLSSDLFGKLLHDHLGNNGVDMRYVQQARGPSTLAFVSHHEGDDPEYAFFSQGAADQSLQSTDLPEVLPESIVAIHVGSYSLAVEPIATALESLVDREYGARCISLDPNVRPSLIGNRDRYLARLERWIQHSDIIKLSVSDAEWLWPDIKPKDLAQRWLDQGSSLIVMTRGASSVWGWTHAHSVEITPPTVQLVDSVGAGDSFMSALLCWLIKRSHVKPDGVHALSKEDLTHCVKFASAAAALACSRQGANPPTRAELAASLS